MKLLQMARETATIVEKLIKREDLGEIASLSRKSFTRKRQLTCERLLLLIMGGIHLSLQIATDNFFEKIGHKEDTVSKQAVSKARTNLNPDIIEGAFIDQTKKFRKCDDIKLWKEKYQICAIDGSDIALDNSTELKSFFGCSGKTNDATTAMLSTAFDPLNNWILDASLSPYKTDERTAAKQHIKNIGKLPIRRGVRNLFILDRGYPSREFIAYLIDEKHSFIMRVRNKFSLDFDAVKGDERVVFTHEKKRYKVRVIKVVLSTGEVETLVTNLSPKELKSDEAGPLYFERWGIEIKYNSLKNKLQLGNFSGRRVITVMQDFWALMFISNMMSCVEFQSNEKIAENSIDKSNKYEQTTNENRLVEKFTKNFLKCLLESSPTKRDKLFVELIADISRYPVEVKPNRIVARKTSRKIKYPDRYKVVGLA